MRPLRVFLAGVSIFLAGLGEAGCAGIEEGTPPEPVGCSASGVGPGDHERSLLVGEDERHYLLHVPPGYRPGEPPPVVLNFHGGAGFPEAQVELTSMDRTADREGFVVVYPFGSGILERRFLTFNAGTCCGYARDKGLDDVALVRAILRDLARVVCIDDRRVYAVGHSNGGMMAHRLGCQLADEIAAVASVAGPIGLTGCHPSRPVSVLHVHGTADRCAPYAGGTGASRRAGEFRSVEDTRKIWLSADGCTGEPQVSYSRGDATCLRWSECDGDAEVVFCTIEGGGHAWPGAADYPSKRICGGELTHDLDANEMIWQLFSRHSLPGTDRPPPETPAELPADQPEDKPPP